MFTDYLMQTGEDLPGITCKLPALIVFEKKKNYKTFPLDNLNILTVYPGRINTKRLPINYWQPGI